MNRQLMALAVGILFFGSINGVHAGVKIYGRLNVSFGNLDNGADSSTYISSNASRLGLKGSEALGSALKLVWQIESGIDRAGESNGGDFGDALASRNTYIGLAGGFGVVLVGKYDTPLRILGRKVALFRDQIGDSRNLISAANGGAGFDLRADNVVAWASKDLRDFEIMVALVAEDGVKDSDAISAHGIYNKGPLMVGVGFENQGRGLATQGKNGGSSGGTESSSAFRAVVSYRLKAKNIKINGLVQQVSDAAGISGADVQVIGAGASFKAGANLFKVQLYEAGDLDNVSNSGARMLAFGVDHKLTKKTKVYGAYALTNNDDNAQYSAFGGGGHGEDPGAAAPGDNPSGISVGIIHTF